MAKCKSIITQKIKRGKHFSLWPEHNPKGEVCGGNITFGVEIEGGGRCFCGDYCYCDSPSIKVEITCSKCRNPFIDDELQSNSSYDVQDRINKLLLIALDKI